MNIIREVEPDCMDVSMYFDGDMFSPDCGDFNYTLFPLTPDHYTMECYMNRDTYKELKSDFETISFEIDGIEDKTSYYKTVKELMAD